MAYKDIGMGGVQTKGIWDVLQGGSAGGVAFRVRDVGADTLYGTDPREFSVQGCTEDHGETSEAKGGGGMGISTAGGNNGGGGF